MHYRAHGRRCAVDIAAWHLPHPESEILSLLFESGFRVLDIDIIARATEQVGKTRYRRGARYAEAPDVFDCSTFTKWVFAQRGIWLPRRAIHQAALCTPVADDALQPGDLVFSRFCRCAPIGPEEARVSHVGIVGHRGAVLHASPDAEGGVVEMKLTQMRSWRSWAGGRRLVPTDRTILTLECPPEREIETSEDVHWVVLEKLDWK